MRSIGCCNSDEVNAAAEKVYESLKQAGVEVVIDDRDERPGVKFKDADLIGYPLRVTIGHRTVKEGKAELKVRTESESALIALDEVAERVVAIVDAAR